MANGGNWGRIANLMATDFDIIVLIMEFGVIIKKFIVGRMYK